MRCDVLQPANPSTPAINAPVPSCSQCNHPGPSAPRQPCCFACWACPWTAGSSACSMRRTAPLVQSVPQLQVAFLPSIEKGQELLQFCQHCTELRHVWPRRSSSGRRRLLPPHHPSSCCLCRAALCLLHVYRGADGAAAGRESTAGDAWPGASLQGREEPCKRFANGYGGQVKAACVSAGLQVMHLAAAALPLLPPGRAHAANMLRATALTPCMHVAACMKPESFLQFSSST